MERMYYYHAYGLTIGSQLSLPQLVEIPQAKVQVTVRLDDCAAPASITNAPHEFRRTKDETVLPWSQVGRFRVRAGEEITFQPAAGANERLTRDALLGVVMGELLRQRGMLVLHASAVAVGDCIVAFVGGKKQGKSTLAATLCARGHKLVADDVVAIEFLDDGRATVVPAFPHLRMCPDAIASLGLNPETLPKVVWSDKRYVEVNGNFRGSPGPLAGVFLLGDGDSPEIEPLTGGESLTKLLGNSYAGRATERCFQPAESSDFLKCAQLVRSALVYNLEYPRSLELLPTVAKMVEDQVAATVSHAVPAV